MDPGLASPTGPMDLVAAVGAPGEGEIPTAPVPRGGELPHRSAKTRPSFPSNHGYLIGCRNIELERSAMATGPQAVPSVDRPTCRWIYK